MMDAVARGGLRENSPRNAEGAIIMQQASLSAYGGRVPSIIGTLLSPLSLVGYNHKDLLYSAIRVHHVQATGRSLADIPSFGGHSGLTIDWGKINFGSNIGRNHAGSGSGIFTKGSRHHCANIGQRHFSGTLGFNICSSISGR